MTARELPVGMLYEVADVLEAHGLQLRAAAEQRPELWAVLLTALGQVVDAVPVEHGGRFGATILGGLYAAGLLVGWWTGQLDWLF